MGLRNFRVLVRYDEMGLQGKPFESEEFFFSNPLIAQEAFNNAAHEAKILAEEPDDR